MSLGNIISNNTFLIGVVLIGGFIIWKFILEPRMNDGQPIKPTEENIKTFSEKMEDNLNTEIDF